MDNEEQRERRRKYYSAYRERNRSKIRAYAHKWREANPNKVLNHQQNYYIRQAQKAEGTNNEI